MQYFENYFHFIFERQGVPMNPVVSIL